MLRIFSGPWFRRPLSWAGGLLTVGLGIVPAARAGFTEVAASAGLTHVQAARDAHELAVYAGAVAAVDVNGDGLTDLVVARSDAATLLYINNGNGTFREEGAARGLGGILGAGGIAAGDFNNNGHRDLFIVPLNGHRCYLLINDGTGHFTEQAVARGADLTTTIHPHHGFSVSLVDYNRDGYLDIYLTEWSVPSSAENHLHSALLRNRGAAAPGHFENVTAAAGLTQPRIGQTHFGFAAAWADFDGDGWPDLALVSDFGTSQFFWNNGDGTFTERGQASGVARDENGMGVAVADYDGDGRLDFYVTSIHDPISLAHSGITTGNKLYRHTGGRQFVDTAGTAGVAHTGWGWGAAFFDYDNRGASDLVVTNGITNGLVPAPGIPSGDGEDQPTVLFRNNGGGTFTDITTGAGIADRGQGRAIVVLDYDHDGDEDLLITQAYGPPLLYRNDASANGHRWLRLRFQGTGSNRDGIGAVVRLTAGGPARTQLYNPTNGFLAQREPFLHFGLGAGGAAPASVEVTWPSGLVQTVTGLAPNQTHLLVEPGAPAGSQSAPQFTQQPVGGDFERDQSLTLAAAAIGQPAPVFIWEKDGVLIPGANGPTLFIARLEAADEGAYVVKAINPLGTVVSAPAHVRVLGGMGRYSVAGWWNRALLNAIRADFPHPPVHARNLFHLSAAMWDAYWAYDASGWSRAQPVFLRETPPLDGRDREAARREAISHAAYTLLTARFRQSRGLARIQPDFDLLMRDLGHDPGTTGTSGDSPAAVGNRIAQAVLAAGAADGGDAAASYEAPTGYQPRNDPLNFVLPGAAMRAPDHWQPLTFARAVTQNQIDLGAFTQPFVGADWRVVAGFAAVKPTPTTVALDPGPPPLFRGEGAAAFRAGAVEVIRHSSYLDPADGVEIDISPGTRFNNPLGTNDGRGHPRNPVTDQTYAPNRVLRADFGRVMAEYWADGPDSETPPGHWNVILNQVSTDPRFTRRWGGAGPELSALEWDITAYLALNGAVHDAALVAWTAKRIYDTARPISMIRHLSGLGQSSDPAQLAYHVDGIPLAAGLIEVITTATAATGQRHAHLADHVGKIAVRSWRGAPIDFATQTGGVGWVLGERWMPYQMDTFVTPAFPGYISGHSTFSRAAAEVMTRLTGSAFFPGGLAERRFPAGAGLIFEYGPQRELTLQWATYYDAADQAGDSRIWGGIHPGYDDLPGRTLGATIGRDAFLRAEALRGGDPAPPPPMPAASPPASGGTNPPTSTPPPAAAPPPTGGGGGGGGSPSWFFLLALAALLAWHRSRRA
jgi:hypothetical protein